VRRIGRYILNGLTVLSLVLCVATVGLWVRSYWRSDALVRVIHNADHRLSPGEQFIVRSKGVCSARGHFGALSSNIVMEGPGVSLFADASARYDRNFRPGWRYDGDAPDGHISSAMMRGSRFGFKIERSRQKQAAPPRLSSIASDDRIVMVPCWLVVLVTGLLPVRFAYKVARAHAPPGLCRKCGYDLRATPDRCPECGTIPTKVKA
jgi:hypothetical protein